MLMHFYILSSHGDDLGSLGRRGSQYMSANQSQVCRLPFSLFWTVSYRTGSKVRTPPSDTISYIIPDNFTGSVKKSEFFWENLAIINIGK